MNNISKLNLILLGLFMLFGCSSNQEETEGEAQASIPQQQLNLYTARHYVSDDEMLAQFTRETGIRVNVRKGDSTSLLAIMEAEGENSPADVIIAADAGTLWRFKEASLTQSLDSAILDAAIPESLRDPDGHWYGLTKRYRVIAFDKARFDAQDFDTYDALRGPEYVDALCVRPSSNIYNLSLMAEYIAHSGEDAAKDWAVDAVANFARSPRGGDRTQLRGIASGECGLAIVNHYYWLRMMATGSGSDFDAANKVGLAFPGFSDAAKGVHTNVTAAAVAAHAPNPAAAQRFIEFLASVEGQSALIQETFEMPINVSAKKDDALYALLPDFSESTLNLSKLGVYQSVAQNIYTDANWY